MKNLSKIPINGKVYYRPMYGLCVLVFMGLTKKPGFIRRLFNRYQNYNIPLWGILHFERHENNKLTAPIFQQDDNGKYTFTENELIDKFYFNEWEIKDFKAGFIHTAYEWRNIE